jgi:hypothetical protein
VPGHKLEATALEVGVVHHLSHRACGEACVCAGTPPHLGTVVGTCVYAGTPPHSGTVVGTGGERYTASTTLTANKVFNEMLSQTIERTEQVNDP